MQITCIALPESNKEMLSNMVAFYKNDPQWALRQLKSENRAWIHNAEIIPNEGDLILSNGFVFLVRQRLFHMNLLILFITCED